MLEGHYNCARVFVFVRIVRLDQVNTEAASMLEDILLLENVGPIILCLLAGPFSDRWLCFINWSYVPHAYMQSYVTKSYVSQSYSHM